MFYKFNLVCFNGTKINLGNLIKIIHLHRAKQFSNMQVSHRLAKTKLK